MKNYESYKIGLWVEVAEYYLTDEVGINACATKYAKVFSEPSDEEELVAIQYTNDYIDYVPQSELTIINDLVKVYYNNVFVSVSSILIHGDDVYQSEPYEVYENCPFIIIPKETADDFASYMVENGDWDSYLIPELLNPKLIVKYW